MRRFVVITLLTVACWVGFNTVASASQGADVVTSSSSSSSMDEEGRVTFTNGNTAATVKYGLAADSLPYTIVLAPHQVVTMSLGDTDAIYWQAVFADGFTAVIEQDTSDDLYIVLEGVMIGLAGIILGILIFAPKSKPECACTSG